MTPQPIRVVLTRPHTHAGKPYKAGDRIDVAAGTADWLVANGIARRDKEADVETAKAEPVPKPLQRKEPKP